MDLNEWKRKITPLLSYGDIDETLSNQEALVWLMTKLSKIDRKFKVYDLDHGVVRVSTDTKYCPCCKRTLGE